MYAAFGMEAGTPLHCVGNKTWKKKNQYVGSIKFSATNN